MKPNLFSKKLTEKNVIDFTKKDDNPIFRSKSFKGLNINNLTKTKNNKVIMNYLRILNKKSSSRNKLLEDTDERIFTPKAKILSNEQNNNLNNWSLKVMSPILSKGSTKNQTGGSYNNNNSKAKFSEGLDFSEIRMNHNNEHDNNKFSKKLGKCFLKTKRKSCHGNCKENKNGK